MPSPLEDLGTKLNEGFQQLKSSFEHFTVLQDSAAAAIKLRDDARRGLVSLLDDMQAAITDMRNKLASDADPPAPVA